MRKLTRFISLLGIAVYVLSACTNQVPSPHQTTVSTPAATVLAPHMALLKLAGTAPASCPITPVFTGSLGRPNLDVLPWMKAEPASSRIVAYLFYAGPVSSDTQTYRPLHTGGGYPDGSTTKILWLGDIPMEAPPRSFGPLTIPMRPWLLKSPGRSSQQVMRRFNKLFPWHRVLGVITHPLSMSLLLDAGSCRSKAAQLQLPSLFGSLETDVPRDAQRDRSKDVNCFGLSFPDPS